MNSQNVLKNSLGFAKGFKSIFIEQRMRFVQTVDVHRTGRMNIKLLAHVNAAMGDAAGVGSEKQQIAGQEIFKMIAGLNVSAFAGDLTGVARQGQVV